MKSFYFTVDDNIRLFKELTESAFDSMFDHPYLAIYRRLHERFDLKVQLNLFYEVEGFDLSMMTDAYREEWEQNASWLRLSFHSRRENERPYESSGYDEVFEDCRQVQREILRFAGESSLAETTTVHYCLTTDDGVRALVDNGVKGLLGLFGTSKAPMTSYNVPAVYGDRLREGDTIDYHAVRIAAIDVILNQITEERITEVIAPLLGRDCVKLMIHEQYFYEDYPAYQPNFEQKLTCAFDLMIRNGYQSVFFEP